MFPRFCLTFIVAAFIATGCSEPTPVPSPTAFLSGTWTGAMTVTGVPAGSPPASSYPSTDLQLTMQQSGSSLSGTTFIRYGPQAITLSGKVSGTVNGSSVSLVVENSAPATNNDTNCVTTIEATVVPATVAGAQMTGTARAAICAVWSGFSYAVNLTTR